MFLLKVLKQNGLNAKSLDCIFSAIVISRIAYAIEAWGSFVTREQEGIINKMFKKAKRWGLCSKLYTFSELNADRSDDFFRKICQNSNHSLFHLMPPLRDRTYNFRDRLHNHQVLRANKSLYRKSFLVQSLSQCCVAKKGTTC